MIDRDLQRFHRCWINTNFYLSGCYWTSIPLNREVLTTEVNVTTMLPVESAGSVNCSITALFFAPAAAKMSKLVNTGVPLMLTLKVREPAVEKKVSAKCSLTRWLDPGAKPPKV